MRGLYHSTFKSLPGREVTMACTQFEPSDARRAFPCVYEPASKGTFRLSVSVGLDGGRPWLEVPRNTTAEDVRTDRRGWKDEENVRLRENSTCVDVFARIVGGRVRSRCVDDPPDRCNCINAYCAGKVE
uniref:Aminopeptidase N-like N-terminal domain-containing protein n=1 Tax=Odontella aurita TaxID=265563 RepID=A0A6U6KL21_9STRA|mmetsp:Transcript_615/g.1886  ORF Transcript_615/g.1886 Transcript_615/m.1886 type:complete len:129 (+) Transcript_615:368-754(+)